MFSVIGQPVFLLGPHELKSVMPAIRINAAIIVFFIFFLLRCISGANILNTALTVFREIYFNPAFCYYISLCQRRAYENSLILEECSKKYFRKISKIKKKFYFSDSPYLFKTYRLQPAKIFTGNQLISKFDGAIFHTNF